ncbi:MAG: DUF4276 family protein [Desulfomonilaceae bacterium]
MMSVGIVAIVEGHGDANSVPVLLSRILRFMNVDTVHPDKPIRQKRQQIVKKGELEKAIVELAMKKRKNVGAILVLLDADKDCPATLGPALLMRAKQATHLPVAVVLAKREFEAWFLGCIESFRGFKGIPADAEAPENPETLGGKGQFKRFCKGIKYAPSVYQAEFARRIDVSLCRERCPSFDKLLRDVEALVKAMVPETKGP